MVHLEHLSRFGDKICILNDGVTYSKIVEIARSNIRLLEKCQRDNIILVDVALGWRLVPVFLAALVAKITVVPIDSERNPAIMELFPNFLVLNQSNVNLQGDITFHSVKGSFQKKEK